MTTANDNRSLSSFLNPPVKAQTRTKLLSAMLELHDAGVPDHVLSDSLYDLLTMVLQPGASKDVPVSQVYFQLRRMAGGLEARLEEIHDLYGVDTGAG